MKISNSLSQALVQNPVPVFIQRFQNKIKQKGGCSMKKALILTSITTLILLVLVILLCKQNKELIANGNIIQEQLMDLQSENQHQQSEYETTISELKEVKADLELQLSDTESTNENLQQQIKELQQKIKGLEAKQSESSSTEVKKEVAPTTSTPTTPAPTTPVTVAPVVESDPTCGGIFYDEGGDIPWGAGIGDGTGAGGQGIHVE